ncbi:MAG: thiamine pyrophosphate-binding protein [Gammaproteobacteria bacterium]|nr:thiamine pyrophosphate-binding protein [Gammaproteobacteria bacterium]
MKIQVSELIVKYLEKLGIEFIFGMPGAHILPVYDSLYHSSVNSVLVKHEQGASFMASGCARASGKISACITTAGPGATNLVTGIASAYVDKQPILVITGETSTHIFGKGGLQESSGEGGSIDQSALFQGITRYHKVVERTDYLANVLNQASKALFSDSPGPVLLSFPFNVQKELVDADLLDSVMTEKPSYVMYENIQSINALTDMIMEARNPVIVAGYGCIKSGAQELVSELSDSLNIPVTSSMKGKGVISEQSALSLGSLGVTSTGYAYKYIVDNADAIIFLGAGFNERTSYLWDKTLLENKKIAQIDSNPEQLQKVFKADVAITADIKAALTGVLNNLDAQGVDRDAVRKHIAANDSVEKRDAGSSEVFQSGFVLVEKFFKRLEKKFEKDLVVFDDNMIFAQNFFNVSAGNRFYPNSGISSLGHAIPAAIGARFAEHKPTIAIIGDGGFQMCCMELMTAVNYDLPITVVMFNNATMGLIRKNQYQSYGQRFIDCDFSNPDYSLLAKSFGIEFQHVETLEDLDRVFEETDFIAGTNLIEIMLDKELFPNYSSRRS